MKKLSILIFTIIITGCAATGPSFLEVKSDIENLSKEKARVVFYRTKESSLYLARKAPVDINNKQVGACAYGGFFYLDIPEGRHSIKTEIWDMPGECELFLNAESGSTYYLQVDPRMESFTAFMLGGIVGNAIEGSGKQCSGAFKLYPASKEIAEKKLVNLRLSE